MSGYVPRPARPNAIKSNSGATIVGKGKPGFPGGTKIPPTRIEILRPDPAY